jgi:hypothetical protein
MIVCCSCCPRLLFACFLRSQLFVASCPTSQTWWFTLKHDLLANVAQTHFRFIHLLSLSAAADATRVPRQALPGPKATKLFVRTSEIENLESVQSTPYSARISTSVFGPAVLPQVCCQKIFTVSQRGRPSRDSLFAPVHGCSSGEERDSLHAAAKHAVSNSP